MYRWALYNQGTAHSLTHFYKFPSSLNEPVVTLTGCVSLVFPIRYLWFSVAQNLYEELVQGARFQWRHGVRWRQRWPFHC